MDRPVRNWLLLWAIQRNVTQMHRLGESLLSFWDRVCHGESRGQKARRQSPNFGCAVGIVNDNASVVEEHSCVALVVYPECAFGIPPGVILQVDSINPDGQVGSTHRALLTAPKSESQASNLQRQKEPNRNST